MTKIKVAKVSGDGSGKTSKRELYARVCYYYPRYTLQEASRLPARDLYLLLDTARRMEALNNLYMTQIIAAPHSKKGAAVTKLLQHFKKLMKE